jgi:uncharacterized protein (DUF433 family)
MGSMVIFTLPQVERLTGLSRRTIRRWRLGKVFAPEYPRQPAVEGLDRRFYSVRDVVVLRTLAKLWREHGVSLDALKRAGAYFRINRATPLDDLRLWVVQGRVVTGPLPSEGHATGDEPGSGAIEEIDIGEIARVVARAAEHLERRDPETRGKIARHREIMSNRPVIAGTRIPTALIWDFHEAGYDEPRIVAEYPDLSPEDVRAAIAYEASARGIAA